MYVRLNWHDENDIQNKKQKKLLQKNTYNKTISTSYERVCSQHVENRNHLSLSYISRYFTFD